MKDFIANGVKYSITDIKDITPARYFVYEQLKFKYAYDASPEQVAQEIAKAHNIINNILAGKKDKGDAMDALTIMYALVQTLQQPVDDFSKANYMLQICTLFINTDGEDVTKWSDDLANEKIANWMSNPELGMKFFFAMAVDAVIELSRALSQAIQQNP
jgi:hypothetical protein